jgi:aminomethyltransferase
MSQSQTELQTDLQTELQTELQTAEHVEPTELHRTALHAFHVQHGAKLVPFAGWEMPVQYSAGVTAEHLHTRASASLFDVSHMGQISLRPVPTARDLNQLALTIESVLPGDIAGLRSNQQRYSMLLTEEGTILDDVMITRRNDDFFVVVNASNAAADIAYLTAHLASTGLCDVVVLADRGLLAIQGPSAGDVISRLDPSVASLSFMEAAEITIAGVACFATRSGYTGEDGFEISVPNTDVELVAAAILSNPEVELAGLAARDTLRLEAGLCLHGHDISTETTPLEASLAWAIPPVRRPGGERASGYPGASVIDRQRAEGIPRRRVGLLVDGRAPVREGAPLFSMSGEPLGTVTSGTTTPTLGRPIAMGYVDTSKTSIAAGTQLVADVRGRRIELQICSLPFVPHRYAR